MGVPSDFELSVHENARMQALHALAPVAMLETTLDGSISWANTRWLELVGSREHGSSGSSWIDTLHFEDRTRVMDTWKQSTAEVATFKEECRLSAGNHGTRWIEVRGAPFLDSQGGTRYVLTITDVTDRRNLQDLARTTRELESWAEQSAAALAQQGNDLGLFAALVASSADAIAIVAPNGTVRYANGAFHKLFDLDASSAWDELLLALGVDEGAAHALHATRFSGETWQAIVTLDRPARDALPADVTAFSILDATLRTIGTAIVVRDLSTHKEVEVERARLHSEIIAAQEAAIRELSTPLLPIGPGILAMPLVGNIDATRGQQILETLLAGIHQHHATVAILDVTGVRQMNADVADILLRSAQAAGLLGTNVLLTGVSAFVAKAIIQLGADLSQVRTLATLEQGIRAAFSHTRTHKEHSRRNGHPMLTE